MLLRVIRADLNASVCIVDWWQLW